MGKHKTADQSQALIAFMEQNEAIAKGFFKGDKVALEEKWRTLAETLNSQGPSVKTASDWKKTWVDWKSEVRKKLAHNKREAVATGGGPFKKFTLSEAEETIARISGLYGIVEGISLSTSFGTGEQPSEVLDVSDDDLPSTSCRAQEYETDPSPTPKRYRKGPSLQDSIKSYMVKETKVHDSLTANVTALVNTQKELESDMKRVYRGIEKIGRKMEDMCEELKSHNKRVEEALLVKNELKLQQIALERERLEFEKSKYV